ncbi:hypothetical protein Cgig2_002646 [Carnegiea gigantea]|uniref:Uncharacterized protein n=1 Tax=Carnegiea gigantea TaxID=171969 RepID=A0A9Q1GP68_9CARY|nr:hypothetical protein Cgig2_002646 [Carnegiea gigantea]
MDGSTLENEKVKISIQLVHLAAAECQEQPTLLHPCIEEGGQQSIVAHKFSDSGTYSYTMHEAAADLQTGDTGSASSEDKLVQVNTCTHIRIRCGHYSENNCLPNVSFNDYPSESAIKCDSGEQPNPKPLVEASLLTIEGLHEGSLSSRFACDGGCLRSNEEGEPFSATTTYCRPGPPNDVPLGTTLVSGSTVTEEGDGDMKAVLVVHYTTTEPSLHIDSPATVDVGELPLYQGGDKKMKEVLSALETSNDPNTLGDGPIITDAGEPPISHVYPPTCGRLPGYALLSVMGGDEKTKAVLGAPETASDPNTLGYSLTTIDAGESPISQGSNGDLSSSARLESGGVDKQNLHCSGYDCGVFIMIYMDLLALKVDMMYFTQKDI